MNPIHATRLEIAILATEAWAYLVVLSATLWFVWRSLYEKGNDING